MRLARVAIACCLALALSGITACTTSGPEVTWSAFVEAVADNDPDRALSYLDLTRMSEVMLEQDESMMAMSEMFGGAQGIAAMLEEQLRSAIESGDFGIDAEGASLVDSSVTAVDTADDTSTLTIESGGEQGTVYLERIDGEWKIVMLE